MDFALTSIRILLLQARTTTDPAKEEEVRSFAARCGIETHQIIPHDLLQGPPTPSGLRQVDALMVGGSGDFYVSRGNLPCHDELIDFLSDVVDRGYPTFASCFGFQFLVAALGGQIIYDPGNMEVGTFELTLTHAGKTDELFGQLPAKFWAQLGHKDRAADHVDGFSTLASSKRVAVEALRVPGKPIWATQFHPELDLKTNLGRFEVYMDGYAAVMTAEDRVRAVENFRESPATLDLLQRFLQLVFG